MSMETEYDRELLLSLEDKIILGNIKIYDQSDSTIEEIEANFVMGFNGIDWDKNEIILSERFDRARDNYLHEARKFLNKLGNDHPHLLDERIVVLGDGLTNLAYEMQFKDFINLCNRFLSIPQHTYIWFIRSKKCLNFTFENEVFFG